MTGQAAAARLLFGMARDGRLPRALASVDAHHGVPRVSLLTAAALTLIVSVWAARRDDGLDVLVSIVDVGALAAFSFHESKNVTSGEGGALVVNDPSLVERAQIIRDRGTNREQFLRREVDEYRWIDVGSAYAPSDIVAAFLLAQIEDVADITADRLRLWRRYHAALEPLERAGSARRPVIRPGNAHNGHIYHLLLADASRRPAVLAELNRRGIGAAFHYVPLHSAPAGQRYGRAGSTLNVTEDVASRLVRLPLHVSLSDRDQDEVINAVIHALDR